MSAASNAEGARGPARKPRGKAYRNVPDTHSTGMLGVGMIIGAVLGAGVALLVAPQAGWETRRSLRRRAEVITSGDGAWTKLGRELRKAARAKRKSLEAEQKRNEIEAKRAAAGVPVV
ncbi:MAG TPA: YtxH domain-containing protein [Gemmatimonadaceae bacterium]|nr:YtxH domain-containing protein [Gemmatimonadaceae bacterium]